MKKCLFLCLSLIAFSTFAGTREIGKNVDVLFVIDNSGSMTEIQQNLVKNSKIFFEQFAKQPYINWKIGIISTDRADAPYLGFDAPFDWSMIDYRDPAALDRAVEIFQDAVFKLGTSGDGSEYVFFNMKRTLDLYSGSNRPAFLRPNAELAVIMITDEEEQSTQFGQMYESSEFLKTMSMYVAADKKLRFYGALSAKDLKGCESNTMQAYANSQYETIINLTKGFNISACSDDFGMELAKIGKDITSFVK